MSALQGDQGEVSAVGVLPDGRLAVTCGADRTVRIWNVHTGKTIRQLTDLAEIIGVVAWSPNGEYISIRHDNDRIGIWNPETGRLLRRIGTEDTSIGRDAWSPDSTRVVTSGVSGTFIWDIGTGEFVRGFDDHGDPTSSVAWSPDNTRIIIGSHDKRARIRDARTGEVLQELEGHTDWLRAVAWSPDSCRVLTGSYDATIPPVGRRDRAAHRARDHRTAGPAVRGV